MSKINVLAQNKNEKNKKKQAARKNSSCRCYFVSDGGGGAAAAVFCCSFCWHRVYSLAVVFFVIETKLLYWKFYDFMKCRRTDNNNNNGFDFFSIRYVY